MHDEAFGSCQARAKKKGYAGAPAYGIHMKSLSNKRRQKSFALRKGRIEVKGNLCKV